MAEASQKEFRKRDFLRSLEEPAQKRWESVKAFEAEVNPEKEKFFVTFPYPYMNGRLHLGHAFSFTKAEFATGYQRLKGKECLFPFGLHCTGMPIKACADKLAREIEMFGTDFDLSKVTESLQDLNVSEVKKPGKVAAKSTGAAYQFQIMQSLGIPKEDIVKFANSDHWLEYFPPHTISDVKALGCKVDWRRSFITTDANPFYDSFAKWQFRQLKALEKIKFGERYTIFSPLDSQPCMDHDRLSGEGVGPQEYTAIKIQVTNWAEQAQAIVSAEAGFAGKRVYLIAATLRPETMYGQTNCYVGVNINYGAFQISEDEVYVCTEHALRNMAYQGITAEKGTAPKLATFSGKDLVGCRVKAPLSLYDEVYVLPMDNVLPNKGTGIVTSVPSDSPDDYATLQDLVKKAAYYNILPEWVVPFTPVPVISTPQYGDSIAVALCKELKINSQKDRDQLAQAKEIAYKEGFYNGTMLVGEHTGKSVQEAKPLVKALLIEQKFGFSYCEPEKVVFSRSGDECVVALCDQWYLDYGEEEWQAQARKCVSKMNMHCDETRNLFDSTLGWLHQWACARSYGLGSRVPWDENFLIESLSDSTIYMSYYTISHFLQGNTVDASKPNEFGILPEHMTDEVWSHVLLGAPAPTKCDISPEHLKAMRDSLNYFYPMDLRVSGKDLIPNHLTFSIYNHVALFPEHHWPLSFRSNGHLLLNGNKMSKSTGNFMTLSDSIIKYGADATRIALADAGDSVEDANFDEKTADSGILRLYTLLEWAEEALAAPLRTGPKDSFHDLVFEHEMNHLIQLTDTAYADMMFREALKNGYYELQNVRDIYREATLEEGMHRDLVLRFLEVQCLLLAPFAPHYTEHIWLSILKKPISIMKAEWPALTMPVDKAVLLAAEYLRKVIKKVRDQELSSQKKAKKGKAPTTTFDPSKPKALTLFLATSFPEWQEKVISVLKPNFNEATKTFDDVAIRQALTEQGLMKDKQVMPFAQEIKKRVNSFGSSAFNRALAFDEAQTLAHNTLYIQRTLGFSSISIETLPSNPDSTYFETLPSAAKLALPGEPSASFVNIEQ
ncbi:cytosolic leucyl tRNA synthetase [Entomophthora muscae]|uniref:Cytosolic leucyl tRNA synthetase n=1 Tax=Entomophthora muscae TaxID=34485 RepID=A0ACC2TPF0_9FUNG|nr:cytosolic leucyl tRNA synthetase [Entomophthora muscae]